jgi:quercetin dioxygenase-like cupin family protein
MLEPRRWKVWARIGVSSKATIQAGLLEDEEEKMRRVANASALKAVSFGAIVQSLAGLLFLGFSSLAVSAGEVTILAPDAVAFKADANIPGVAIALIAGNPKEGAYTIRARFSTGVKIPAHFHPDERVVTVISGTYYFAAGDKFDEGALKGYGPGTVIVVPAGSPHFSACKDDVAVVQESGVGPTGIKMTGK